MRLPQMLETYRRYVTHLFAGSTRINHSGFRAIITSRLLISLSAVTLLAAVFHTLYGAPTKTTASGQTRNTQTTASFSTPKDRVPAISNNQTDQAKTNDSQAASQSNHTSVEVNGQHVTLPPTGEMHKTITDENGSTSIDYSSTANGSNSSTNLSVQSSSSSSSSDDDGM